MKIIICKILVQSIFFNGVYSRESSKLKTSKEKGSSAIELSIGKFHPGPYAPLQIKNKEWSNCYTLNLCNIDKLFGSNMGIKYIYRMYNNKNHSLDIDTTLSTNKQNIKLKNKRFSMISVVPTYRYLFSNINERINIGIGGGINISMSKIPYESIKNKKLNTQLNLEFGYRINKENKTDMTLGIKHRCTLFGLIGDNHQTSHWYTIGIRQWL